MFPNFSGCSRHLKIVLLTGLMLVVSGNFAQAAADLHHAAGLTRMQTPAPTGVVVVKMNRALLGDKANAPQYLAATVGLLLPDAVVEPRFSGLSRSLAEGVLSRYFQFRTKGLTQWELLKVVATLNADASVEVAFLEPVAVPAALGFDAFTGAVPEVSRAAENAPKSVDPGVQPPVQVNTPDFENLQGYLAAAPLGVGALPMRSQSGALGAGITIIDIEGAWLWAHEDLPDPVIELGQQINDLGWRYHGTAVMGEMRGHDNGFGVTGITPDCSVGASSIGGSSTANALASAVDNLQPGDLILIELHAPGPNANGSGQFGYVPMEYWPDNFDIIRLATAKGIIVCEAAGNGYQNLDGPEYLGLFDRTVRDSGAIMCGATAGSGLFSADFSNNGTRVDLNGWGWSVTTCGYGDLQSGDETELYTADFSGTSSASPIVTGSVASLQGMVRSSLGFGLDARMARNLLRETGTPMTSGSLIGTRPNLEAAFAHADTTVGEIIGTVIDLNTALPVSGALVQVDGNGSFTMTDENGQWRLPLSAGIVTLEFSSYYHYSTITSPPIIAGQTVVLNVSLVPFDLINITGRVYGPSGAVAGVLVTPTDQPVLGDTSDANGFFSVSSVPAMYDYTLMFDGVSGYGARVEVIATSGLTEDVHITPILPVITEDFGFGDGGFSAEAGLWTHGAPPVNVTGGAFVSWACWGIGMDGDYGDDENDILTSRVFNLSGVTGGDYFLSFHFFSATEAGFDGVNLEVAGESGFELLQPLEGYTDPSLGGLGGDAGWSGQSGRWQGTVFDIGAFADADFQFRLNYGSDSSVTEQGFYIDGIAFGSGLVASPVPGGGTPSPLTSSLKAWPNPFNPLVNLDFSISKPGHLLVDVFDVRGNRVRTLLDAPVAETRGTLSWDGLGDSGRTLSSGVYFVRLVGPDNQTTSQRVVLAK